MLTAGGGDGDVRGSIQAERELQLAPRAIAVLSSAYLHSPDARSIWKTLSSADAADTHRQLIPVRISEVRITEPFNEHPVVDLARMDAAQATAKLLWALDRPAQPLGRSGTQAEEPRFPGTIPPIWNVPARNADFTGRGATLELLRDKLAGGGRAVVVAQALYGLGGVGKTQLALEYAHRFMADYDLVWWVPSERAEETSGALADLARKMGLKVSDNVAEAAEAALEELRQETTPHWLLIFDNADDPKQLEPYLPTGSGHVLITSRNQGWTHSAEPLEVDVFTRDESVGHLLRHVPELDMADAQRVADALGHLPLAVEQASAWLEQTGTPPGLRGATGDTVHPDSVVEPAAGLSNASRGDLEPLLRPPQAAVACGGAAPAAMRVLLARTDIHGPAVQRRDE